MRIAITGASGFLGQQLVPYLQTRGVELLLVGRDPVSLHQNFPGTAAIGYDEISQRAKGYDLLLHLVVVNNNNRDTSLEQFTKVNVDLAVDTCCQAKNAGIKRFIYVSSTHALNLSNMSLYAQSKRSALLSIEKIEGIDVRTLYLPAILGDRFAGKLGALNSLPQPLRSVAVTYLRAFKPTVHSDKVGDAVLLFAGDDAPPEKSALITDGQLGNLVFQGSKRLQDLTAAVAIILLFWWAMVIIWIAVRLQSPGPGFYRQKRVGRDGEVFTCYKFRTMYIATPSVETHQVTASSVTAFGKFLRRSKLDELPQVLNILFNQMSLVGPRPCLPSQTLLISKRRQKNVFQAKPGITGLAQVNGIDMSNPSVLAEWDQRYLQLQSIFLDVKIIIKTALGKGGGDNVR